MFGLVNFAQRQETLILPTKRRIAQIIQLDELLEVYIFLIHSCKKTVSLNEFGYGYLFILTLFTV